MNKQEDRSLNKAEKEWLHVTLKLMTDFRIFKIKQMIKFLNEWVKVCEMFEEK